MHYSKFFVIFGCPQKTVRPFRNFLAVLPPPTLHNLETWKIGWYGPTLFVGWESGLGMCELKKAPQVQKCPKTFVHDRRLPFVWNIPICLWWWKGWRGNFVLPFWTWLWRTFVELTWSCLFIWCFLSQIVLETPTVFHQQPNLSF